MQRDDRGILVNRASLNGLKIFEIEYLCCELNSFEYIGVV